MQSSPQLPHVGRHRLEFLDSIRALCAIAVIYLHGSLYWQAHSRPFEAAIFHFTSFDIDVGKIGVIAFFMVSGFVIPISLKPDASRWRGVRKFLIGRAFRLYPAYWLSMIGAFGLFFHWSFAQCSLKRVLLNATMFQRFFGAEDMIGLYWTLQIEWIFYLVCVGLYACRSLDKPRRIFAAYCFFMAAAFLMAIVRFKTHRAIPLAVPLSLAVMLMSTLWRMVVLDRRVEVKSYFRRALVSFIVCIPVISTLGYSFDLGHQENWYRYTFVYWIAVTFFLLCTSRWKINWRPLAIVGQGSYSLYLFYELFQDILFRPFLRVPVQFLASVSPHIYLGVSIVLSSAISLVIYERVEKPMIMLGRKLSSQTETRPEVAAGVS